MFTNTLQLMKVVLCLLIINIVYLVISSFSSCPFFFLFFVAIITSVCDYYNCLREREL